MSANFVMTVVAICSVGGLCFMLSHIRTSRIGSYGCAMLLWIGGLLFFLIGSIMR